MIIHDPHMKAEEGTISPYSQSINGIKIHQFFAIGQFFNTFGIDHFLYGLTNRVKRFSGKFPDGLLKFF